MSTKKIPRAFHPGEYLSDEIKERGWSQKQFADILGIDKSELNNILHERRNITPRIAVRIGTAFGTSAELWINLQNRYDMYLLSEDKEEAKKISAIPKRVAELALA